jgi:hypothetical protein
MNQIIIIYKKIYFSKINKHNIKLFFSFKNEIQSLNKMYFFDNNDVIFF